MDDGQAGSPLAGINMDGLQTMGIVNAMRTGDPYLDMVIAMLIPLLIKLLFDFAKDFEKVFTVEFWKNLYRTWYDLTEDDCERTLMYSTRTQSDNKNTLLIKAVLLYVNKVVQVDFRNANIDLASPDDGKSDGYDYWSDDESDDEPETYADRLKKLQVLRMPMNNEWVDIGEFGEPSSMIEMLYNRIEKEGEHNKLEDVIITLKFRAKDLRAIDSFIDLCFNYYVEEMKKAETNYRYFYELKTTGENRDGDGDIYSRYRLSDEKTFDSLFFPQKENLLRLLKHFLDRTGKYAIKGYPHKLGLLLHGPPGTGKTSFIKALAEYTGRSIININLARIKTNKHLMKIFFNKNRSVEGEYIDDEVGFKDAIFVMEDVDAASNVVKRRDGKKTADVQCREAIDIRPKSMWEMLLNSSNEDCQELVGKLMESSERLRKEANDPKVLQGVVQQMKSLPGLTVVTENVEDKSLKRIGEEALEEADKIIENASKVSEFLAFHARKLKTLLESGADVTDAVVSELLDTEVSTVSESGSNSSEPALSRDVSWTQGQLPEFDSPLLMSGLQTRAFGGGDGIGGSTNKGAGGSGIKDLGSLRGSAKATGALGAGGKGLGSLGMDDPLDIKGGIGLGSLSQFGSANTDALNLSGLLNCLDGVVDSPGRLVILTSNHPEVLDPALVRPGRIDKKLMLGYMNPPEIAQMLQHYFQTTIDEDQYERIEIAILPREGKPRLNLTPAQVEQLTAEHEELDDMITALEKKGRPPLPRPTAPVVSNRSTSSNTCISTRGISITYDGV